MLLMSLVSVSALKQYSCAVQIPESGKIYAFNEGNYMGWTPELREYIDSLKQPEKWGGKPYSARCSSLACTGLVHGPRSAAHKLQKIMKYA